jgi:hypothetical protein
MEKRNQLYYLFQIVVALVVHYDVDDDDIPM